MRLVGHPEVIDEPWFATGRGRAEHADVIDEHVGDWIAQRGRDEALRAFEAAGAAIAPVYDARDLAHDQHVRETQMLTEVHDDDLGTVLMHNVMWRMSATPGQIRFTGRALGADTDTVLGEVGYDAAQLSSLRDAGVIA
jgi:crotonobetainyl-CoA:carnitine CoA-transferase CaiB-like acyl-CoA transferase